MKYLRIFTNWRIIAITAMFCVATLLLLCETENATSLAVTKISGIAMMYVTGCLFSAWEGRMNELNVFNIDEDDQQ